MELEVHAEDVMAVLAAHPNPVVQGAIENAVLIVQNQMLMQMLSLQEEPEDEDASL